ncbi:MAG: cell wall-binding repeat-containing protein [Coriobacteriia bacterium]|nr:cell wall-binding repeat-containing protein [Coriobacteriia bacterium]
MRQGYRAFVRTVLPRTFRVVTATVLSVLLAFPPVAYAAPTTVYVTYDITEDTTWSAGSLYVILKRPEGSTAYNPVVKPGVTLTIEPGAQVVFGTGQVTLGDDQYERADGLQVSGAIRALGTADAPIAFTSATSWDRIEIKQTSAANPVDAVFQNCVFEYGLTMLDIREGFAEGGSDVDVSVSGCTFQSPAALDNYRKGIAIYSDLGDRTTSRGTLVVTNSSFAGFGTAIWYHNQTIEREDDIDITIDGCTFDDNGFVGPVPGVTGDVYRAPVVLQGGDAIRITDSTFTTYPSASQAAVFFGYDYNGSNYPRSANLWGNTFSGGGSGATPPVLYRQGMRINDDAVEGAPNTYAGYAADALYATFVVPNAGTDDSDAYWGPVGLDYRLSAQVTVGRKPTEENPNAGSLTVGAGVTVRLAEGGSVAVNSALRALGTAEDPVTFTGFDGGTVGFLDYSGESVFRHAIFEHMLEGLVFYGMGETPSADTLTIEDCLFRDNVQSGMIFYGPGAGTISNSVFEDNGANGFTSSANAADEQRLVFEGCTFRNNIGTGVTADSTYGLTFRNCLMHANGASGVYVDSWRIYQSVGAADPEKYVHRFINCTIAGNVGHGIESGESNAFSAWYISSSILSGNAAGDVGAEASTVGGIVYSAVSSAEDEPLLGWESIVADPQFADPASGDFHLKSQAGRWNGSAWVTDATTSPCVNGGDPGLAYASEPAPNGSRVNMGMYGGTAEASKADGPTLPGSVAGLVARSTGANSITLEWTANSGAEGYEIHRTESALQEDYWVNPNISPWLDSVVVATLDGAADGFEDTDVWGGQYYYYAIREFRTVGDTKLYGGFSPLAVATPVPSAPQNIGATAESSTRIRVAWDRIPGAYWYRVWYRPVGSGTWDYTAPLTGSEYDPIWEWYHEGLAPDTSYEYWVEGAYSSYRQWAGYTYYWGEDSMIVSAATLPDNGAPVLSPIATISAPEQSPITFTAQATHAGGGTIVYSLENAPTGATIDPASGVFTWTPTVDQIGEHTFGVWVVDPYFDLYSFPPVGYDAQSITVTVVAAADENTAPVLTPIGAKSVAEGTQLAFTASATDADIPANALTFSLGAGAPAGAAITAAGAFTWTPTEAQGPGSYPITIRVSDGELTDSETITVTVTDSGTPPVETELTPVAGAGRVETAIEASKLGFADGSSEFVVIATARSFPDALGGSALAGALHAPILLTEPAVLADAVKAEIARLGASHVIVLGGTGAVSAPVYAALDALPGVTEIERIEGSTRYQTAEKIAERTIAENEAWDGTAFVATGESFPDALGASPLAAAKGWPIYLVHPNPANQDALVAAMDADGVFSALILGGTGVVPATLEAKLDTAFGAAEVDRLSGANRYDTAVAVATYGVEQAGLGWNHMAFATGEDFPDALAGGALQGASGSVMLLAYPGYLHPGVQAALVANKADITEVRFLGGTGAVPQAIRNAVIQALQ